IILRLHICVDTGAHEIYDVTRTDAHVLTSGKKSALEAVSEPMALQPHQCSEQLCIAALLPFVSYRTIVVTFGPCEVAAWRTAGWSCTSSVAQRCLYRETL